MDFMERDLFMIERATCYQTVNAVRSLCITAINSEAYIQKSVYELESLCYTDFSVGTYLMCVNTCRY